MRYLSGSVTDVYKTGIEIQTKEIKIRFNKNGENGDIQGHELRAV